MNVIWDDTTRWILGRPNFTCGGIARLLRTAGQVIERRAEDEQAAVLYWMLEMRSIHGDNWREAVDRVLADLRRASAPAQPAGAAVGEDS